MNTTTAEQEAFLATPANEAGFCGGNGTGKTWSLLFGATKYIEHPNYTALILRRHCDEAYASLVERAHAMYKPLGGKYNSKRMYWTFRSGARIEFGFSDDWDDAYRYGGADFQYIGIDGIDMFDARHYEFFLSRLRSNLDRLPYRMRFTFPNDPDCEWVSSHFAPWLVSQVKPGELVYYKRESMRWTRVQNNEQGPWSRTLIKAKTEMSHHHEPDQS
jgi:hypothetical protein